MVPLRREDDVNALLPTSRPPTLVEGTFETASIAWDKHRRFGEKLAAADGSRAANGAGTWFDSRCMALRRDGSGAYFSEGARQSGWDETVTCGGSA